MSGEALAQHGGIVTLKIHLEQIAQMSLELFSHLKFTTRQPGVWMNHVVVTSESRQTDVWSVWICSVHAIQVSMNCFQGIYLYKQIDTSYTANACRQEFKKEHNIKTLEKGGDDNISKPRDTIEIKCLNLQRYILNGLFTKSKHEKCKVGFSERDILNLIVFWFRDLSVLFIFFVNL